MKESELIGKIMDEIEDLRRYAYDERRRRNGLECRGEAREVREEAVDSADRLIGLIQAMDLADGRPTGSVIYTPIA